MKVQVVAITIIILVALAGLLIYQGIIKPKANDQTSFTGTQSNTTENNKGLTNTSNAVISSEIVSLTSSDTQMLISLGLGKNMIGLDSYSYTLLQILNMTSYVNQNVTVFSQIYPPNISGLVALHPSLVIGEEGIIGQAETQMKNAGLNVYLTNDDYASNFYEIEESINQLGNYLNVSSQAQQLINWMNSKLQNFSTTGNTSVAYLIWICPNYEYYYGGGNVFINTFIQLGGGINALGEYSGYGPATADTLIQANPQVLIVSVVYNLTYTEYLVNHFPGIQNVSAYKNNRIYYLDSNAAYLTQEPGPLSVYAVLLFRDIINGTAPNYITWNWIEQNIHPTLPVY